MPILLILTVVVQVLFAIHVIRTGRNNYWLYLILIVPGMGCFIYFLVEVLPEVLHGTTGRKAKKGLLHWIDPGKEFRKAKYAFETSPTVANRIELAKLLTEKKDYNAVIALLEPALTDHFADDVMLLEGLAYAYYDKGEYAKAFAYIEKIYAREDVTPQDYIKLLRARTHIALGNLDAARTELEYLLPAFTGEEARVALARLYARMEMPEEARKVYQDIVTRGRNSPKYYQRQERHWIDMAKKELSGK